MHLIDQRTLGVFALFLLGLLVIIKRLTTGTVLDKPKGVRVAWLSDTFNLFFLLIANPGAAILLLTQRTESLDPTHVTIDVTGLLMGIEIVGLFLYVTGYGLMAWALTWLRRNFQAGGSASRLGTVVVMKGPYRLMRNPMYAAVLCISLGLAGLIQSLAYLIIFGIYLALLLVLIPIEEEGLRRAYGEPYLAYQRKVKRLVPFLY